MSKLYQIDTGYACGGIEIDENGICFNAAPIFKWMIGKHIKQIYGWKKIKSIEEVKSES